MNFSFFFLLHSHEEKEANEAELMFKSDIRNSEGAAKEMCFCITKRIEMPSE